MNDFMKSGLFGIFILGVALCALSTISAVVVLLVETPLFSTQQIERLAAIGVVFCTGVVTCVLCALASAALDYADKSAAAHRERRENKNSSEN
jgi:type VI protein secretion system component VasK